MTSEKYIWRATPSQIINLFNFIFWGLLFWLVIPLFIILWKWLVVKTTKYELSTQRLKLSYGVLNKHFDELELYRVKDYKVEKPFFLRIFHLGNIIITTSDKSHPIFTIKAIKDTEEIIDIIRNLVEVQRNKKSVREVDFE